MNRSIDWRMPALILLAFAFRFWGAVTPAFFLGDEVVHIPAAVHFIREGRLLHDWIHPPLNHLLTYAGILLFGDNPYGWRLLNIILGSLSAGVLVALGKKLFHDSRVAYLAGAFLAVEPMHIVLSRTNFMEIAPVFFFLCGVYATLRYVEDRQKSLLWAGGFFGLAMAGKWYFLPPLILMAIYACLPRGRTCQAGWKEGIYVLVSLFIVPAGVYLLTYAPWFKMGHNLQELFQFQLDMYRQLQVLRLEDYRDAFVRLMPSTTPWNWFVIPLIRGIPTFAAAGNARFMVFMSNWPVWLSAIPACLWSVYTGIRKRNDLLLLTLLLFLGTYCQFALVDRPIFLYSATAVLPFLYLLVSFSAVDIIKRFTASMLPYRLVMSLVIAWGIYLYPFITERLVPVRLYAPLLAIGSLFKS